MKPLTTAHALESDLAHLGGMMGLQPGQGSYPEVRDRLQWLLGQRDRLAGALDDIYLCCFSHGESIHPSRHDVMAIIEQARKG